VSEGVRAPHQAPGPPWLDPADLEALAQRFPPLDAAQVRQLALAFDQGSTPVEVLLLRLAGAGLAPPAAQQLIVDLRLLRERRSRATTPSAAAEGSEVAAALTAAARSYLLHPGDDEQAASAIVAQVDWSPVRARWFLSVNQDLVRQTADRLRAEHSPET
jgi:hypothetical protein